MLKLGALRRRAKMLKPFHTVVQVSLQTSSRHLQALESKLLTLTWTTVAAQFTMFYVEQQMLTTQALGSISSPKRVL